MTRNLKALGLALVAVFAMSALAAQGASATEKEHEFHADGEKTIVTGTNSIMRTGGGGGTETVLEPHTFAVGSAGTVTCSKVETEGTQTGTLVSEGTYKSDTITVTPRYDECIFGEQKATVKFNHCAYVFDSDTTSEVGTPTAGEHANVEIQCSEGSLIEIETTVCTITVGPQTIKHAVSYENDKHNENAINVAATAHKVKTGKKGAGSGCLLFPTGEIGTYKGTVTSTCTRDENAAALEGTAKTTPKGTTEEGPQTRCTVTNT